MRVWRTQGSRVSSKFMILLMAHPRRKHIYKVNFSQLALLGNADGFSGEYKVILQLVGVLSHGKTAKRLADGAIDLMQDVQNLRKAVYECAIYSLLVPCAQVLTLVLPELSNKLKLGACEKGSTKYNKLFNLAANYLFVFV